MAEAPEFNYKTHRKFVPAYHFVALGLIFLYLLWSLYNLIFHFSLGSIAGLCLALGVFLALFYARIFPLAVQDRVIYLEQELRLRDLLPAELHDRIPEIKKNHRVALRFAHDDEVPGLVERILAGELKGGEAIKKEIRVWVRDPLRM
jgi:hypothetical protein